MNAANLSGKALFTFFGVFHWASVPEIHVIHLLQFDELYRFQ